MQCMRGVKRKPYFLSFTVLKSSQDSSGHANCDILVRILY